MTRDEIYFWTSGVQMKLRITFKIVRVLVLLLLAVVGLMPASARAYVYFSRDALTASFFGPAEVETVTFAPDSAQRAAIEASLGYKLPKPSYEILIARDAGQVSGYAIIDEQVGQHDPITFGLRFDAEGRVLRVEVMVYREPYGDGIRSPVFLGQFAGKDEASAMKLGKDVRIVSGSTISSRSAAIAVRRGAVLIAAFRDIGA